MGEGFDGFRSTRRVLPPDEARAQLADELGSYELFVATLARRVRERGKELLGREWDDRSARTAAAELAKQIFDRWAEAGGAVPRVRRELPPQTWKLTLDAERFAREWNESTWLHEKGGQGRLTVEELRAGPFLTPQEFVDWNLDWWAHEIRAQTQLNCIEIGCLPLFITAFVAIVLSDEAGVPWWLGVPAGIAVVALIAWPYRRLRHRGYLTFGDD